MFLIRVKKVVKKILDELKKKNNIFNNYLLLIKYFHF
jgi:hypothetical protein